MMEIITKKEQNSLLTWIYDNEYKFEINHIGKNGTRKCLNINSINFPNLFFEIKERILIKEKITKWELDPFFGDLITFNSEGGFIHVHTDPTLPNKKHLRFNLFLSKPLIGGDPIYDNKKLEFEERCYIRYRVDKYEHSSLPVVGSKPRIALSYGISID